MQLSLPGSNPSVSAAADLWQHVLPHCQRVYKTGTKMLSSLGRPGKQMEILCSAQENHRQDKPPIWSRPNPIFPSSSPPQAPSFLQPAGGADGEHDQEHPGGGKPRGGGAHLEASGHRPAAAQHTQVGVPGLMATCFPAGRGPRGSGKTRVPQPSYLVLSVLQGSKCRPTAHNASEPAAGNPSLVSAEPHACGPHCPGPSLRLPAPVSTPTHPPI